MSLNNLVETKTWFYLFDVQGLILNPEPYYNEAGYEKQKSTQTGYENSRVYNEMAVLKLVQVSTEITHLHKLTCSGCTPGVCLILKTSSS